MKLCMMTPRLALVVALGALGCARADDRGSGSEGDAGPVPMIPDDARDTDEDGIVDAVEGTDDDPVDTDGDGIPDHRDLDADGDTIADADESTTDPDGDGRPSFRDLDSDGDGLSDEAEAGDDDLTTPPVSCDAEILVGFDHLPASGEPAFGSDGRPDYLDPDRDGDAVLDGVERDAGLAICGWDTDGDGASDLVERALEATWCPTGDEGLPCRCAQAVDCGPELVPDGEEPVLFVAATGRETSTASLTLSTAYRKTDVAFLVDRSTCNGGLLNLVQSSMVTLADGVGERAPDASVAIASFTDFPFGIYGGAGDEAFALHTAVVPADRGELLGEAVYGIPRSPGGDTGTSANEALLQLATGEGGRFTFGEAVHELPEHAVDCPPNTRGAPCFRSGALPVVLILTSACGHGGPGDSAVCAPYLDIVPPPASGEEALDALNRLGAMVVGLANGSGDCEGNWDSNGVCSYLRGLAEETNTLGVDGAALVIAVDNAMATDTFISSVLGAFDEVFRQARADFHWNPSVGAPVAGDLGSRPWLRAEARAACSYLSGDPLPATPCWETPDPDVDLADALTGVGGGDAHHVLPGTRLDGIVQVYANRDVDAPVVVPVTVSLRTRGPVVTDDQRFLVVVLPG